MSLIAWHGFLGCPAVWNLWTADDFGCKALFPAELEEIPSSCSPRFLMGYSLGGRLALKHLLVDPHLYQGAILISTHPGLQNEMERKIRLQIDEQWACSFEKQAFNDVLNEWNAQDVFAGSAFPFPPEERKRFEYAEHLRKYSLGLQADLRQEIAKLKVPLLWITGEKDSRFSSLAEEIVKIHPLSSHITLRDAGHRAPWDQPKAFASKVKKFLLLCI